MSNNLAYLNWKSLRHGHARRGKPSPIYNSWRGMIERCTSPKHKDFKNYGGRGIKICKRWYQFDLFLFDMKPTWRSGLTLERKDNNADYDFFNCRWATRKEQMNNCRYVPKFEYKDRFWTIPELAELCGLKVDTLHKRINRRGWRVERAVETPLLQ